MESWTPRSNTEAVTTQLNPQLSLAAQANLQKLHWCHSSALNPDLGELPPAGFRSVAGGNADPLTPSVLVEAREYLDTQAKDSRESK